MQTAERHVRLGPPQRIFSKAELPGTDKTTDEGHDHVRGRSLSTSDSSTTNIDPKQYFVAYPGYSQNT